MRENEGKEEERKGRKWIDKKENLFALCLVINHLHISSKAYYDNC